MSGVLTPKLLLEGLGIRYIDRPNRLGFCCPFHNDTDPSAGFYQDTQLAHCFSCSYTLDMVGFYARWHGFNRADAEVDLKRSFGLDIPEREIINTMPSAKARVLAEKKLFELKGKLDFRHHAALGEKLDKIILVYERGLIDHKKLDKAIKMWYNSILDVSGEPRELGQAGIAGINPDARLKEGDGHLSGIRAGSHSPSLQGNGAEVADRVSSGSPSGKSDVPSSGEGLLSGSGKISLPVRVDSKEDLSGGDSGDLA